MPKAHLPAFLTPAIVLALVVACLYAAPAAAAVLICDGLVEGDGREHAQELEAKKAALESWHAKAGPDFTWRLATNKAITCLKTPTGRFLCKAAGHPCALRQVPPDGPLKRLMPSAPGQGV